MPSTEISDEALEMARKAESLLESDPGDAVAYALVSIAISLSNQDNMLHTICKRLGEVRIEVAGIV